MTILVYLADPNETDLYIDVNNLESPMVVSIPIGISNTHTGSLYFQSTLLTGSYAGYSNITQNLGLLASGSNTIYNYTFNRDNPSGSLSSGELDETITFKMNAYTDAGYSSLYKSATLSVPIHYFDHTDGSWTVVAHHTFDSGTLEGWAITTGTIDLLRTNLGFETLSSEEFLSSPYSLVSSTAISNKHSAQNFNTSTKTRGRFVIHVQTDHILTNPFPEIAIMINSVLVKQFGVQIPGNSWVRLAFNMPIGASIPVKLASQRYMGVWIDEIWVITK